MQLSFVIYKQNGAFQVANPLVSQLVRYLPSTETTRDQSLAIALMMRDLGGCVSVGGCASGCASKNRANSLP